MSPFEQLTELWRADAGKLEEYGDERTANLCRHHAEQLEAAARLLSDEHLTLTAASSESGYSVDRLRHMVATAAIPNAGRKGAPRIRRGDLPRKPNGADLAIRARQLLEVSR